MTLRRRIVGSMAAGVLLSFLLAGCTPFEASQDQAYGPDALGVENMRPMTYEQITLEYPGGLYVPNPLTDGLLGTPVLAEETHQVVVDPEAVPKCVAGELDILGSALECRTPADALITYKDDFDETVLYRLALNSGQSINTLMSQVMGSFERTIVGPNVDVFLCIDSNRNGRCADELVVNINNVSQLVVESHTLERIVQPQGSLCPTLAKGMILFHKHHAFKAGASAEEWAGRITAESTRNLPANAATSGDKLVIPMPLVKGDPDQCPPPPQPTPLPDPYAPRTDGCFAAGTKIKVANAVDVRIEDLRRGSVVLLADGRASRVRQIVAGPEKEPIITFETDNGGRLTVTQLHPLLTEEGMKQAREISIGEKLKSVGGNFVSIKSISQRTYSGTVYNIELAGADNVHSPDHLLVAEGLVSGDLFVQTHFAPALSFLAKSFIMP